MPTNNIYFFTAANIDEYSSELQWKWVKITDTKDGWYQLK